MKPGPLLLSLYALTLLPLPFAMADEPVRPADIEFRREAVRRMVFDEGQAIPLNSVRPASVRDFDLMHPELQEPGDGESGILWALENGGLTEPPPTPGLRRVGSRWVEEANS